MRAPRKAGQGILLLAVPLLALTACGGDGGGSAEAQDASDVTLTVGTPNRTGVHRWLLASGEGEGSDYTIEYADFDSTSPLMEALNAGEVDIAIGGETGVFFAIANGVDLAIVGAQEEFGETGYKILVQQDSELQEVADLEGARIALPYFSRQHYQLAETLRQAGLDWDDADIVNLSTTDGLSALNTGEVDAYVVWDPQSAIAEVEHGHRVLFDLAEASMDPGALYINAGVLENEAEAAAMEDLVGRVVRAHQWTMDNRDEWAQQLSELAEVSTEVADLAVSRDDREVVPVSEETLAGWQEQVDYFYESGEISEHFEVADHVDTRFDEVILDAGGGE